MPPANSEAEHPTTQQLTRAGLNLIGQALSIYDSDLRLATANRRFQEMFALPLALCTPGAAFKDTIHYLAQQGEYGEVGDVEDFVRTRVTQARAFQAHYMERTRANGRTISVEGSPLPQGGWVTVYTDITAIKGQEALLRARSEELSDQLLTHAEQLAQTNRELAATNAALEEAKHQLTEMEARIRMTTEMMPAHIAHVDTSGIYTYSNRRLPLILPTRPAAIIGQHLREALGQSAFDKVEPYLKKACQGTASTFEFTDADSSRRIRTAFTPDMRAGKVRGVYILSMDVTEETQARATLAQTHKRELAAQLTSGLAHDFGNLLTIILGTQSRLARMGLPDEAATLIAATRRAARRGGTLLDRIAAISGPRDIHPEPLLVGPFLRDVIALATPTLPEGVDLNSHTTGLERVVLLDPGTLQDSLLNLILNARDAIGAQPGKITITAHALRDTWLEITVCDTGPGFSPPALEHALDPFFTTKGGEGSGLGLSMVYDLTKLAGGHVRLENTGGGGARVVLRLPLRRPSETAPPRMVLLVEDSPELRSSVRHMLTDMGHRVVEAASVEEGLTLAALPEVDFILSDISLQGEMTGDAMLDALRARGCTTPACLMTSLPTRDPRRAAAAKRYRVLAKPVTQAQLDAMLAEEPANDR